MSTIAIDAREYTTSTGRYIFRLLQYLETIDEQHDYLVLLKPQDMDVAQFTNPRFKKVLCPHKEFTFDEQIGYRKQLEQLRPDLVHFGMVQQPVRYKGKAITTMHDLTTCRFKNPSKNQVVITLKQQVYKWVNKKVAHKSDVIITPSEFVRRDVADFAGIAPDKISVTYEAADAITDAPEPIETLAGKRFIMYIGRPMPHKNLRRLIEAFRLLQAKSPELHLALAGKKDVLYQQIEDEVKAAGITNVVFTDFVSEGQLRWMYENCQAYVFPSLSEGFGLPGLEAMRHGAPVVSSNATCLPEIYGEAAHYFDPLDVTVMAKAINDVLTDKDLHNTLILKGYEQAARYSWRRMAEQTLAIYKQVLGEQ